jgi:hypothetical protein
MIAVAVLAALLGVGLQVSVWPRRAAMYRALAADHAQQERGRITVARVGPDALGEEEIARMNEVWVNYHRSMKLMYEHASARPWIRVPRRQRVPLATDAPGGYLEIRYNPE